MAQRGVNNIIHMRFALPFAAQEIENIGGSSRLPMECHLCQNSIVVI